MRTVDVNTLVPLIRQAVQDINFYTPEAVLSQLQTILKAEPSPEGRAAMRDIVDNRQIATKRRVPMCQDTGMVVVFLTLGQDVHLTGGSVYDAINEGIRQGYAEGYLRKSVVGDPLFGRQNTRDNTPAVIHVELAPGESVELTIAAKGFGAENMSQSRVLTPAEGIEGVKHEVVRVVEEAGPNACPPVVVGVGVGGTLDLAALLAKRALMRETGVRNPDPNYANLELELLDLVNRTGIGPQGWGGVNTALDVRIESYPTHIAGIPLSVNLDCHLQRHTRIVI